MRCHVCDKTLTEAEIIPLPKGHGYEPCSVCLEIALDAAYSNGFVREDPLDDPYLEDEYGSGEVETLDSDFDDDGWFIYDYDVYDED